MPDKKIKVLIVLLFLIAGFVVTRIAFVFDKYLQPVKATVSKEKIEEALGVDVDKDGIPDTEEAYYRTDPLDPDTDGDGFLDGEEVVSSCDPIRAGPDDCRGPYTRFSFEDKDKNFTDELASLMVSGIYSGDLKPDSDNFNHSLATLGNIFTDIEISNSSELEIKTNNSPTDLEKKDYLNSFNEILKIKFAEPMEKNPLTPEKVNSFFEGKGENKTAVYYTNIFTGIRLSLEQLEVPNLFLNQHKNFLNTVKGYELIYESLVNTNKDPLKGLVAISKMADLSKSFKGTLREIDTEVKKNNIKIQDSHNYIEMIGK